MTAYDKTNGDHVRGFLVLIDAPGYNRLRIPCAGSPPYTGEDAIRVMRDYADKRPGVKTLAYTEANGIEETLTLQDMAELYDDEEPELVTVP